MSKIVFTASTKGDAEQVIILCEELLRRGNSSVHIIGTDEMCCDRNMESPTGTLNESSVPHSSLTDYGTKDMVSVLRREKASVLVVSNDQEYVRRSLVYAAIGLNIPVLLLDMSIGGNKVDATLAAKRTVYRLNHHLVNIIRKYLYILRTALALRWNPLKLLYTILNDIRVAFVVYDNRGKYGCQFVAVAGSWEKQVLVERGVAPDKIAVTGDPTISFSSSTTNTGSTLSLRNSLGIQGSDKVILLLTSSQVEHGSWTRRMRTVFTKGVIDSLFLLLNKSTHLVIKIHPVEDLNYYQDLLGTRLGQVILSKDLVLADAINMSDIVLISGYSTTVLEASARHRPVILLNVFNDARDIPYVEMGLAVEVMDLDRLKLVVEELLHDSEIRAEYIQRSSLFYDSEREFTDGLASIRIAKLIMKMASGGHIEL